ncbi:hypothetical protein [Luteolibacter sp. LG18]|uniref:hypothetical protein n=1 Tax=Luteolibacter sp. LG18 TaxID=2819286 RepID=UPI0030C75DAD
MPFVSAMFWAAMHYLCVVAWITSAVMFAIRRDQLTSELLIGSMVLSVLSWIWAFFKRRAARCPLCKGTPLLNSGALPHGRAVRLAPLNHGVSATLSLLFTQEFRCMYCGNLYDLLKPCQSSRPPVESEGDAQ